MVETRVVSLSPKSMVDSKADWPLHRVIEHLRKAEQEEKPTTTFLFCRSVIKLLPDVVRDLASTYGVSQNSVCSWLTYHGLMISREDKTIGELTLVCARIRRVSLMSDDTDTIDMMNNFLPYAPHVQDDQRYKMSAYEWVSSEFEDMAAVCGVPKFRIAQVFVAKSILSEDASHMAGLAHRLDAEVSRWDRWMTVRLGALQRLAESVGG